MRVIPLAAIPNQSLSVRLDGARMVLRIKEARGVMVADLEREGVTLLSGVRVLAGETIIPYEYLEEGNFLLQTLGDELPAWSEFGKSQTLLYIERAEIDQLRLAAAPAITRGTIHFNQPEIHFGYDTPAGRLLGGAPRGVAIDFRANSALVRTGSNRQDAPNIVGPVSALATLVRASPATYFDAGGVLRTVLNNQLRIDHDPLTGETMGALLEPERTNLFPGSATVGGSGYSNVGLNVTQNAGPSPDGNSASSLLRETTANSEHRTLRPVNRGGGVDFWHTVFVGRPSANARDWVYVWCGQFASHDIRSSVYVNTLTGEISNAFSTGPGPVSDYVQVQRLATGAFRVRLRGRTVAAGGNPQLAVSIATPTDSNSYPGDGVSGILAWGYQTEDGLEPSSYIATTTAAATRAADALTVNLPSGSWSLAATLDDGSSVDYGVASGSFLVPVPPLGRRVRSLVGLPS